MTLMYKRPAFKITVIAIAILCGGALTAFLKNYYRANVLQSYKMPSASMNPTLLVGDCFLADKSVQKVGDIKRGDIVIFVYPGDRRLDYVKRAIGLPGDVVEIKDKQVFINGRQHEESYIIHTDSRIFPADSSIFPASAIARDNMAALKVPEKALFVMGDNRDSSNDSRFWGLVREGDLKGRATTIYWSWDRENSRVRWDRIGMACR